MNLSFLLFGLFEIGLLVLTGFAIAASLSWGRGLSGTGLCLFAFVIAHKANVRVLEWRVGSLLSDQTTEEN